MDQTRLPSALASIDQIQREIGNRTPGFFLDFDGTLAPIAARPEMVGLSDEARAILTGLAARRLVCFVSGRGLADLRSRVAVPGAYYAGDHGCLIVGPPESGISHEVGSDARAALEAAAGELRARLAAAAGVLIEEKGLSLSVHYRLATPGDAQRARREAEEARLRHPGLRLTEGKCVLEFRPAVDWGKGHALRWLAEALDWSRSETCPICIGDDLTDEDLFAAAEGWGIPILVGPQDRPTLARYTLPDPDHVVRFLGSF